MTYIHCELVNRTLTSLFLTVEITSYYNTTASC